LVQQFHNQQLTSLANDETSEVHQSSPKHLSAWLTPKIQRLYKQVQYEPLAVLLSCVKGVPDISSSWDWGRPYLAPIKFFNALTMPRAIAPSSSFSSLVQPETEPLELIGPKKDQQKQLQQLNSIIYGLVSRFCFSADSELCLAILNQAHKGTIIS